mmetsp:Transcript_5224/g.13066  ORF Transcript_5224/g.13066 Transcript_5224/m.13066 type:complete len:230 (-) Transcript_5224:1066-1755(-)
MEESNSGGHNLLKSWLAKVPCNFSNFVCIRPLTQEGLSFNTLVIRHKINGRKLCLSSAGHKHNRGLALGMPRHSIVNRLSHCHEPARKVTLIKRLEVDFERDRPHLGRKVEQTLGRDSHPFANLTCIGKGSAEAYHAQLVGICLLLFLSAYETHAGNDYLHCRTHVPPKEVHVIHNEKGDSLDGFALPPSSTDGVPLLGSAHNDFGIGNEFEVHCHLSCKLRHLTGTQY